jgi:hypothetical protein
MTPAGPTFLILSRSRFSYLQVAIVASDRFLLEYQEGGVKEHYQSVRHDLSRDDVVRCFEAYRQGADSWRDGNEWRRIDPSGRDVWDRVSSVLTLVAIILVALSVIAYKRGHREPVFGMEPVDLMMAVFLVLLLPAAIIDMRRFRTMLAIGKSSTIGTFIVSAAAVLYWIARLTSW